MNYLKVSRLSWYIIDTIAPLFVSIFLSLFSIASIVLLVQLASSTAIVQVSLSEFLFLYILMVPQLLLYTLPATFFASCVMGLAKLSFDLEMIVLFSLQATLKKVLKPLLALSLMVTLMLGFVSLYLAPLSLLTTKFVMAEKKLTATLNIKSTEVGQRFGDWLIFSSAEANTTRLNTTILYYPSDKTDRLIFSAGANTSSTNDQFELTLSEGRIHLLDWFEEKKEGIKIIDYSSLLLNKTAQLKELEEIDVMTYWQKSENDTKRARDFRIAIFTTLFPLLSLFLIPAIGIINPRYQKNRSYLIIMGTLVLFYTGVSFASHTTLGSLLFGSIWMGATYFIFRLLPAKRY